MKAHSIELHLQKYVLWDEQSDKSAFHPVLRLAIALPLLDNNNEQSF